MNEKTKALKFLSIAGAVCTFGAAVYSFVFPAVMRMVFANTLKEAGIYASASQNVTVIGSADGPTSIFVASVHSPLSVAVKYAVTALFAVATAVFFVLYRKARRSKGNENV